MNKWFLAIFGLVVITALYIWSGYNGLVTVRENVANQWSQVETQYLAGTPNLGQ